MRARPAQRFWHVASHLVPLRPPAAGQPAAPGQGGAGPAGTAGQPHSQPGGPQAADQPAGGGGDCGRPGGSPAVGPAGAPLNHPYASGARQLLQKVLTLPQGETRDAMLLKYQTRERDMQELMARSAARQAAKLLAAELQRMEVEHEQAEGLLAHARMQGQYLAVPVT
ncbi:hypothetical protein HaLaN_13552 [Haematococcus lacustris]|uniref:Uncharacterized protein n=1 Tax=Haematococcus lacustris TaxID=44745 RepID=A0A699ZCN4_HAELA|nr:hypothetical protein HaLaN_13552 [Haematococcus lacustris]